jgi:hypothetical protein
MSLLRITLGLIVGINIHIDNAESRAGVIRRRMPLTARQFNLTQFFQRGASPVCLRPRRIETTLAFAAVLITEHPQLALTIASQPVWTEQTRKTVISGRNGPAPQLLRTQPDTEFPTAPLCLLRDCSQFQIISATS